MTDDQKRIEDARARMTALAVDLQTLMDPIDVVGLLIGAANGILLDRGSPADLATYLRRFADELEADDGAPVSGHA
jgi:hypothetical protein